jgi:YggT family protein
MPLALQFVVYYLLFLYYLLLAGRLVLEIVRSFARDWRPTGPRAAVVEVVYVATDPPVKLLRKLVPTVRIGGVGLDLSLMILLIVAYIALSIAQPAVR